MFRGRIGRHQRTAASARHRGDHHDPPLRPLQRGIAAEQRTKSLRGDDRPDDVDVHLAAEFVGGKLQHRPRDRDAGVVDQPGEGFAVQRGADLARRRQHLGFVGDVEQQRGEIGAEFGLEAVGVGLLAHAAEHAKAAVEQQLCRGPADAGGRAGDDDGLHGWLPLRFSDFLVARAGRNATGWRVLPTVKRGHVVNRAFSAYRLG